MNVLSIQSHVVYGHVGNSVAVFALQRLGHDVWPISTVGFSNHPGYGRHRGDVAQAGAVQSCIDGLADLGVLGTCDAIISGYLGAPATGDVVAGCVARVRTTKPNVLYCCDPVLGDDGRLYVSAETAAALRGLVAQAEIATPNLFELAYLTDRPVGTAAEIDAAVTALHGRGPACVLLTSVVSADTRPDEIETIVSDANGRWIVSTPRLPLAARGAGDLMAALFVGHILRARSPADALRAAVSAVYAVLELTLAQGRRELALVAAQEAIVRPPRLFAARAFKSRS